MLKACRQNVFCFFNTPGCSVAYSFRFTTKCIFPYQQFFKERQNIMKALRYILIIINTIMMQSCVDMCSDGGEPIEEITVTYK